VLSPRIFAEIEALPRAAGGEIQLTDAIASLLRDEKVFAYRYQGKRYDCGSKLGFLQATVDLATTHPEVSNEFSAWLKARD
jgi:UTP--glucose-1-phosphate uridylyltransferase